MKDSLTRDGQHLSRGSIILYTFHMKKVIISDFFGVVVDESAPVFFKKYFPENDSLELGAKYFHPGDRGEITFDEIVDWVCKDLNFDKQLFRKEILDTPKPHKEYIELLRKLKEEGHMIVLLSNASNFIVPYEMHRIGIDDLFDAKVISYDIKVAKPAKEIFEYALKKANINAKDAIFIDDNIKNCQAAESVGIETVVFKNDEETLRIIRNKTE